MALETVSGNDRRLARIAPLERRRLHVQPKPALLLLRPMTLKAMLLQDRPHVPVEVHRLLRHGGQGDRQKQNRDWPKGSHHPLLPPPRRNDESKWAIQGSNLRPQVCDTCALAN